MNLLKKRALYANAGSIQAGSTKWKFGGTQHGGWQRETHYQQIDWFGLVFFIILLSLQSTFYLSIDHFGFRENGHTNKISLNPTTGVLVGRHYEEFTLPAIIPWNQDLLYIVTSAVFLHSGTNSNVLLQYLL